MIESLNTIRSLGLAPIFEDLYFKREVSANVDVYMSYPAMFRNITLTEAGPLTEGGLIPIVDDGNAYNICLFDPAREVFVVKSIEEPEQIVREFRSWQRYLCYALFEIADSGAGEDELADVATAIGFSRTSEFIDIVREMESLTDQASDELREQFIEASTF